MSYKRYLEENRDKLVSKGNRNKLVSEQDPSRLEAVRIYLETKGFITEQQSDELKKMGEIPRNIKLWEIIISSSDKPYMLDHLIHIFRFVEDEEVVKILSLAVRDDRSDEKYNNIKLLKHFCVKVSPTISMKNASTLNRDAVGLAFIINITEFDPPARPRNGAQWDKYYMEELWGQLGYNVRIFEGRCTRTDLKNIINRFFYLVDLFKFVYQSCVIFIGTEGELGYLHLSDGAKIKLYEEFVFKFTNPTVSEDEEKNKVLKSYMDGIAKLFIFNSCQVETGIKYNKPNLSDLSNTILAFSTTPGEESLRDVYLGSWYIYTFTDVFMKNAYSYHTEDLLKMVAKQMLKDIGLLEKQVGEQLEVHQSRYFISRDMKPLWFPAEKSLEGMRSTDLVSM